jgi:hypothetical protein
MKEGAYLILTVPAFQFLWGRHDTDHHHKRRYDASSLRGALRAAGLEIEHMSYFNSLLFPIIATVRLLEKMWPGRGRGDDLALPGAFVNRLLEAIFASERHIVPRVRLPFGVSLLAVARNA